MKVLVTGGAGYIGSVVTALLLECGHEVTVLDDFSSGHRAAVSRAATLIESGLGDLAALRGLLEKHQIEAVMHFAGNIQVGESMRKPFKYVGDNVRNALNLLQAMTDVGVNKFIFSSTAAIFAPSDKPIAENSMTQPGSPYGESKYIIERTLGWLDQTTSLRYVALRYFNAAGSWKGLGEDHRPETHLIPRVLDVPLGKASDVAIYGDDYPTPDGTCVRDYIHVRDLADAHILALNSLNGRSRVYNLGNGAGFSVKQLIEVARSVTGHPIPVRISARRAGDVPWLVADSQRIRAELGWRPLLPKLEEIIATAWEWRQAYPNGYAD